MSHIQGQTHPEGMTEHLDYLRIEVDQQGALSHIAVVTHHRLQGFMQRGNEVTIYRSNPGPGERDVAVVLTATRRTALQAILTALTTAVGAADSPTDPAPPLRALT
jgi:hypothetical protein